MSASSEPVVVIGAGLAGTSAAAALRALGREVVVLEAEAEAGGHTRSRVLNGVTVDEGPHVSFTRDERVRKLFSSSAGDVVDVPARVRSLFRGTWLEHPAHVNLHPLGPEFASRCIADLASERAAPREVRTYADWLRASYGSAFAEAMPFAYTRKYWTVEPEELGTDWIGERMHRPELLDVVRGAVAAQERRDFHYISGFRYPRRGGFQAFTRGLAEGLPIRTGRQVCEVDVSQRVVTSSDGERTAYDELVSSMPLDRLVGCTPSAPPEVREAAEALLCTSVALVDVTTRRGDLADADWFYVYDEDVSFARAHLPHRLSPENAPRGVRAIQAEVYSSRRRPLEESPTELVETVVRDLVRTGLLATADDVEAAAVRLVPYANVVFDHHRAGALATIVPWFRERGVHLAGRYGRWDYSWSDDAVRAGWEVASHLLEVPLADVADAVVASRSAMDEGAPLSAR